MLDGCRLVDVVGQLTVLAQVKGLRRHAAYRRSEDRDQQDSPSGYGPAHRFPSLVWDRHLPVRLGQGECGADIPVCRVGRVLAVRRCFQAPLTDSPPLLRKRNVQGWKSAALLSTA